MSTAELYTAYGFAADDAAEPVALDAFLASGGDASNVMLEPDSRLDEIVPHLGRLKRITIRFPKFNDGRGYSLAARLRLHHGYKGVLRATGDVLIDQVQYFFRQGFDELLISHEPTLKRLKASPEPLHHLFGQADVRGTEAAPAIGATYSWRRSA
jgi:uncharacterized protein (DUF934 family)